MRIYLIFALLFTASSNFAAIRDRTVFLVIPFENLSGIYDESQNKFANFNEGLPDEGVTYDRYTETPRNILENILANQEMAGLGEIEVVERSRIDAIIKEKQFATHNGLVSDSDAVSLGRSLDANLLVVGTLLGLDTEIKSFSGYGIQSNYAFHRGSLRIRIINIETGRLEFSTILKGEKKVNQFTSDSEASRNVSEYQEVIEQALQKLVSDLRFKRLFEIKEPPLDVRETEKIAVTIDSDPSGADVYVDGKFVGNSPTQVTFAKGARVNIRISRVGFSDWSNTLDVEREVTLRPALGQ